MLVSSLLHAQKCMASPLQMQNIKKADNSSMLPAFNSSQNRLCRLFLVDLFDFGFQLIPETYKLLFEGRRGTRESFMILNVWMLDHQIKQAGEACAVIFDDVAD
jgi:hypothetical protein